MARVLTISRDEQNRDPLAVERETRDFQRLFARVIKRAPPPIGVGPAAGG